MEYTTYTFRKNIDSVRGGYIAEAQRHLQPLEEICREAGGIVLDDEVYMPATDIYHRTQILLVDKTIVQTSVYLSHQERREQSSVQTKVIYRHQGIDMPLIFDKIRDYYHTKPALQYQDSHKRLAGERFVPQGVERKR